MQKITILSLCFILISPGVWSFAGQILQAGSDIKQSIEILTGEDPRDTLIRGAVSSALSMGGQTKEQVYQENRISLFGPFTRSLAVGFGSGSASIGDEKGQVLGALGNGIGLGSILLGTAAIGTDWITNRIAEGIIHGGGTAPPYKRGSIGEFGMRLAAAGGVVMIGTRLFEGARVLLWGWEFNRNLRTALSYEEAPSISFAPIFDNQAGSTAVRISARIL